MKQTEMFRKAKVKPKVCNWILLQAWQSKHGAVVCNDPATVTIAKGAYCHKHREQAEKMFGTATPITA